MSSADELSGLRAELDATATIDDLIEQMLEVAAIVEEAVAPLGIHPVVVGGLAVAYWVPNPYLTYDIDVVMPRVPALADRMSDLGFEQEGRFWVLPGREIFFEAPDDKLEPRREGSQWIESPSGRRVRIQSPEDVLAERLQQFIGTGNSDTFQQSLWLLGSTGLSRDRLEAVLRELGLHHALKVLDEYAEKVRAGADLPELWELKELAERLDQMTTSDNE